MHRFAVIAVALLASTTAVSASPQLGTCVVQTTDGAQGAAAKSCSDCQWECLTNPLHCTGITFDGVGVPLSSLPTWSCGDNHWLEASPGLCVLYDTSGAIFDTQEQGCQECLTQCQGDARCAYTVFNYVRLAKDATTCVPPPPSPVVTPSPIVTPSPVVTPSPIPPPPSPVITPSPVPVPSPMPMDVGGDTVTKCVLEPATVLPVPADAQGTCVIYSKDGNVLDSSTVTCDQCQWQCLTWGTSHSDCASISYAGSAPIDRNTLANGLCPAAAAAADATPLTPDTYGLCVLKAGGLIQDTQMMHCWTCVEQCKTWGPNGCDTMVFRTDAVPASALDNYCSCPAEELVTLEVQLPPGVGRKLLRA